MNKICRHAQVSKYCQIIICGGKWTIELAKLSKAYVKNYGLVFGSFLEAACYAKLKPVLIFVENKGKPQALLGKDISSLVLDCISGFSNK